MRVVVAPNAILQRTEAPAVRIALFDHASTEFDGDVGNGVARDTANRLGRAPSTLALDFAAIAFAVLAADQHVNRALVSPDGWTRELELSVTLRDPEPWTPHVAEIEQIFRFLTGDLWSISFIDGGCPPLQPTRRASRTETCISLLSGGLDSLIGAIDLAEDRNSRPFLVSSLVQGDSKRQADFAEALAPGSHMSVNPNVRTRTKIPEHSQRPRSLAFIALGVLAATTLDKHRDGGSVDLFIPENGFISLNVPLTSLRMGSLSTRTTHPFFIQSMQALIDASGLRVKLKNPYQYATKGEMMAACANQARLAEFADETMSCGVSRRHGYQQCGRCLPCIVRRGAFLHWSQHGGQTDATAYAFPKNKESFQDMDFAAHDDVMQCREALLTARKFGTRRWIGPAISPSRFQYPARARDTAARGLNEIETFLHSVGLA